MQSDRFLEIELVTNTVTGLKDSTLSSIVTKEFYADSFQISHDRMTKTVRISGFHACRAEDNKGDSTTSFVKCRHLWPALRKITADNVDNTGRPEIIYLLRRQEVHLPKGDAHRRAG